MNLLFIIPMIFIAVIVISELYIEIKQRYTDWRKHGR